MDAITIGGEVKEVNDWQPETSCGWKGHRGESMRW